MPERLKRVEAEKYLGPRAEEYKKFLEEHKGYTFRYIKEFFVVECRAYKYGSYRSFNMNGHEINIID